MAEDARYGPQIAEEEASYSKVSDSFKAFAEEVRRRNLKDKTSPVTIPQKLQPAEFNTAIVHFYRGEIQRSNVWRNRLDATTNWAVITTGATLSFVFSSSSNPHFAIPVNTILVSIFLFMEARRYRYYEVWASRVRVLETGYFGPMLSHRTIPPDKEWADHLAADLMSPRFTISEWEAIGKRLRANYLWLFILLALSWTLKIYIHPEPIPTETPEDLEKFFDIFISRASIGLAPGWLVIIVGVLYNLAVFFVAFSTKRLQHAASEVLPLENFDWHPFKQVSDWAEHNLKRRATFRRSKKARQRIRSIHKSES